MRAFSFGGGVQSTAALVLAAQGKIDYKIFLFANVGDDSENPDTLAYVRDVSKPFALAAGLKLITIRRETNNAETLYQRTLREDRSIHIPVRMANGAPGTRDCTQTYKRTVIRRWCGNGKHVIGLGISWDESHRMRESDHKRFTHEWPLIDLRLRREDCHRIIRKAGLPTPPKSSCWFCPFHNTAAWMELRNIHPNLFQKTIDLEVTINAKRAALGKDNVFFSAKAKPLSQAIGDQPSLFEEDTCESGYCMI